MIENERTKLTANALDRASTACLAVGIFAPLASLSRGEAQIPILAGLFTFAGWIFAAFMLHMLARRILGGLVR